MVRTRTIRLPHRNKARPSSSHRAQRAPSRWVYPIRLLGEHWIKLGSCRFQWAVELHDVATGLRACGFDRKTEHCFRTSAGRDACRHSEPKQRYLEKRAVSMGNQLYQRRTPCLLINPAPWRKGSMTMIPEEMSAVSSLQA